MTEIDIPNVSAINAPLLDSQLKAAAPKDCFGLTFGSDGLSIVVSDTIEPGLLATLKGLCFKHDPAQLTPEQQAELTAKQEQATFVDGFDALYAELTATISALSTKNPDDPVAKLASVVQQLAKLVYYNNRQSIGKLVSNDLPR